MDAKERLAELMALQGGLSAAWPTLSQELERRMDEYIARLITRNDEETRGRIKELIDLLDLPARLQQEAQGLAAPQQEAELP